MPQGWKIKLGAKIVAMLTIASAVALTSCEHKTHMIGSVNTEFKLIGPDHKIIVESYDDPKIEGITVFVSKSQTGGIKGALGLAEDTSNASVAVRQTGPIKVKEASRTARTRSPKNAQCCLSACMSADFGIRRIKVLST
jgi:catabolite regulation protein CreA